MCFLHNSFSGPLFELVVVLPSADMQPSSCLVFCLIAQCWWRVSGIVGLCQFGSNLILGWFSRKIQVVNSRYSSLKQSQFILGQCLSLYMYNDDIYFSFLSHQHGSCDKSHLILFAPTGLIHPPFRPFRSIWPKIVKVKNYDKSLIVMAPINV